MSGKELELEKLSEIGDGASVAAISIITNRLLEALTGYLLIQLAGPALFGLFSILQRTEQILVSLAGSIRESLTRTLPRLETGEQDAVLSTTAFLVSAAWLIIASAALFFEGAIVDFTALEPEHAGVMPVFALSMLPFLVIGTSGGYFFGRKQIRLGNLFGTVGRPLAVLAGSAGGVLAAGTLLGAWTGTAVAVSALAMLFLLHFLLVSENRFSSPLRHVEAVRDYLGYLSVVQVSSFFSTAQYRGVFVFMAVLLEPVAAGLFSLSYGLSAIARIPLSSVNQIFSPVASELYSDGEMETLKALYQRTSLVILYLALPFVLGTFLFSAAILGLFSAEYLERAAVLPVISAGQLVAVSAGSVGLLLKMTDRHRQSMWVQIGVTVAVMPAVWLLTESYGVLGLAAGTALLLSANNISEMALLKRETGLFPFTPRHLKVLVAGALLLAVAYVGLEIGLFAGLVLFLGGTAAYLTGCYRLILKENDRELLRILLSTMKVV